MTKKSSTYLGNRPEDRGTTGDDEADEFLKNRPTKNHIVRKWNSRRHLTLTPEAIDEIADLVAGGSTVPVAATACGCATKWANWSRRGKADLAEGIEPGFEEGQSPYAAWAEAIIQAKASFEVNMTLTISGLHNNWKAARDILDARIPGRWKIKQQASLTVKTEREEAASKSTAELEAELGITPGALTANVEVPSEG